MSSDDCRLSTRSLAELALLVSRVSSAMIEESASPSAASMRLFWQSTRSLQQRWLVQLDEWSTSQCQTVDLLEQLAPRVFTCEMLVRTWSTVLASLDFQRQTDDQTRLARNATSGLLQIRNGILSRLLTIVDAESVRLVELDRLRRRCDRWTDLLVGPIAVGCGCFEFAIDEDRARDFSEEGSAAGHQTGPRAFEHLVSAGLRLALISRLPTTPIDDPELVTLSRSILSAIPAMAFHRDASLRTSLERRIAASRLRLEQRPRSSKALSDQELPADILKALQKADDAERRHRK